MAKKKEKNYRLNEWRAEGERLFGTDYTKWRFRCPKCGNVATGQEFKDAGAPNAMYFESKTIIKNLVRSVG